MNPTSWNPFRALLGRLSNSTPAQERDPLFRGSLEEWENERNQDASTRTQRRDLVQLLRTPQMVGIVINSQNKIKSIPLALFSTTHLFRLCLKDQRIPHLPPEIKQLTRLEYLAINNCETISLPSEIGELSWLTTLNLSNNNLTTLPEEIGKLKKLNTLTITYNKFTLLPLDIGTLPELSPIWLSPEDLETLLSPGTIESLKNRGVIELVRNLIYTSPPRATTSNYCSLWKIVKLTEFLPFTRPVDPNELFGDIKNAAED